MKFSTISPSFMPAMSRPSSRERRAMRSTRQPFFQWVAKVLIAAAISGVPLPLKERSAYLSRQPPPRTTWPLVKRLGKPPAKRKTKKHLN